MLRPAVWCTERPAPLCFLRNPPAVMLLGGGDGPGGRHLGVQELLLSGEQAWWTASGGSGAGFSFCLPRSRPITSQLPRQVKREADGHGQWLTRAFDGSEVSPNRGARHHSLHTVSMQYVCGVTSVGGREGATEGEVCALRRSRFPYSLYF